MAGEAKGHLPTLFDSEHDVPARRYQRLHRYTFELLDNCSTWSQDRLYVDEELHLRYRRKTQIPAGKSHKTMIARTEL